MSGKENSVMWARVDGRVARYPSDAFQSPAPTKRESECPGAPKAAGKAKRGLFGAPNVGDEMPPAPVGVIQSPVQAWALSPLSPPAVHRTQLGPLSQNPDAEIPADGLLAGM